MGKIVDEKSKIQAILSPLLDKKLSNLESTLKSAFDKKLSALKSVFDKKLSSLESKLSGKIKIDKILMIEL